MVFLQYLVYMQNERIFIKIRLIGEMLGIRRPEPFCQLLWLFGWRTKKLPA